MSIQAITRVIPPILEEASSVTNGSDSISTTQDVVASATASVTNGSDSILTTQNVVESATSSNTQATSQKASRVRRCWDRMTAVFSWNTSRADVALSNNVSIENVALTRLIPPILEEASSVTNGSDSISTTQDVVASATASVTNGSDSILTTQNVVESATSSNTQATSQKASRVRRCWDRMTASQKASRVRRCWDRMTAVFSWNTSRADVALSNNVSIENVALTRLIPPILEEASSVTNGSDSISTTQDVVASATASVTNGSDSISTTQDIVASATASVTNGSDSISTTQNVVESATSSNTQATSQKASRVRRCWDRMTASQKASRVRRCWDRMTASQKASRVRRCWDRMTAVFSWNTSRADVALSNNVSIENVALIGSAVQNKTERLASDLVKIKGLVDVVSGLKESNLHSQNTISEYVRQNPIGFMSIPETEQFADYILTISRSNIDSTKKTVYFERYLTQQFHYPECSSNRCAVQNKTE